MGVRLEGKNVCRAFDIMSHNDKKTPQWFLGWRFAYRAFRRRGVVAFCADGR
jgi:hypothetical protein